MRNSKRKATHRKYILDANISKCLERINHDSLIKKLDTFPEIEQQVKAWLSAGIMEGYAKEKDYSKVEINIQGTPQGGVISPFLSNIALPGMQQCLDDWMIKNKKVPNSLTFVRYADDFVLIHREKQIIIEAKEKLATWLAKGSGLEFSESKTRIRDLCEGCNFLGFTIILITRRNLPRAKIYSSRRAQQNILLKVRDVIIRNRSASAYKLINLLRPQIIGWANYYKHCEWKDVFHKLTHMIFLKLRAWVFRRDTRNGRLVVKQKYFPSEKT